MALPAGVHAPHRDDGPEARDDGGDDGVLNQFHL